MEVSQNWKPSKQRNHFASQRNFKPLSKQKGNWGDDDVDDNGDDDVNDDEGDNEGDGDDNDDDERPLETVRSC